MGKVRLLRKFVSSLSLEMMYGVVGVCAPNSVMGGSAMSASGENHHHHPHTITMSTPSYSHSSHGHGHGHSHLNSHNINHNNHTPSLPPYEGTTYPDCTAFYYPPTVGNYEPPDPTSFLLEQSPIVKTEPYCPPPPLYSTNHNHNNHNHQSYEAAAVTVAAVSSPSEHQQLYTYNPASSGN